MLKKLVVVWSLVAFTAFGQNPGGKVPSGSAPPTPAQPGRNSGEPDAGNNMQLKSIDQVLHDYAKLSAKLQAMLPPELPPQPACSGFKTLEQCVTTIHVAQNLKIPFSEIKGKTTGKGSVGLQKAIEQMAAGANAKDEVKKAKKQASEDMKGTNLFGALLVSGQTAA